MNPHTPTRIARALAALAAVSLTLALAACNDGKAPPAAPASSSAPADPNVVTVDAGFTARLKIETVGTAPQAEALRVAGRLDFDEQHLARIGATVTGRVTRLIALPGQRVRPGDVLAELNSAELGAAQLNYLKALAQSELARRAAERARTLYDSDVIGGAELQRRQSEAAISAAEARAAHDQLRVLGMSPSAIERLGKSGAIDSVTPVVATITGTVVERKVNQGQVVQPADALFTVADLSRVWAVAQVPEQQAALVEVGKSVTLEIPALGNETRVGTLIHVGETVDPETRTVLVRTELDNAEGRLKPAMLATMLIAGRAQQRLVVPASAVVRDGEREAVFVAEGEQRFRLTPVKLGSEIDGLRAVLSGVKAGDRVVGEGSFHLNNERKRAELEGGGS